MTFFPDAKTFVQIGSLSIAWYAVFIITGAFIAYKLGQHNFKKIGYDPEVLSDYFFGVMITGILEPGYGMLFLCGMRFMLKTH